MKDEAKRGGTGGLVLTALVGLVAGAALTRLATMSVAPAAEDTALAHEAQAITRELAALNSEVAALRRELGGASIDSTDGTPGPQALEPHVGADDVLARLAEAVTRLAERAPLLSGTGTSRPPASPAIAQAQQERVGKLMGLDRGVLQSQHMLWSVQQLADEYGPPGAVEVSDTEERWYWGDYPYGPYFMVTLHDGHVISARSMPPR